MKCRMPIALIAGLITISLAAPALASPPTTDSIAAALKSQADACGPSLDVTYKWGAWAPAVSSIGGDRTTARYVRTPTMLLMQEASDLPTDPSRSVYNRTTKELRTIAIPVNKAEPTGSITHGEISSLSTDQMVDVVYYPLLGVPLIERIAKGVAAESQDIVGGRRCWRMDIPREAADTNHGNAVAFSVWLDPSVGMCPRLIVERFYRGDEVTWVATTRFHGYRSLGNGVFMPMEQTICYNGDTAKALKLTVEKVSIGKEIPESEFMVTFPSGTRVFTFDESRGKPRWSTVK